MKKTTLMIAFGLCALTTAASAQSVARYIGADGDWSNPRNWSTGRVPDRTTDVMIGGRARVVIDPARTSGPVVIRDLRLQGHAVLETQAGTQFFTRHELLSGNSRLVHRSTEAGNSYPAGTTVSYPAGSSLVVATLDGWTLNPTPKQKRIIVLQSSVTTILNLGGALAASPAGYGRGHYATITADFVRLDGRLNLGLMYGFQPQAGQSFQIVTVNRHATGRFNGLREGALAARFGDVGLFITYEGGDGNDVVLEARRMSTAP